MPKPDPATVAVLETLDNDLAKVEDRLELLEARLTAELKTTQQACAAVQASLGRVERLLEFLLREYAESSPNAAGPANR